VDSLICALTRRFDTLAGNMLLPASRSTAITDVELPSARCIAQTLDDAACALTVGLKERAEQARKNALIAEASLIPEGRWWSQGESNP
jgi:hypothetical protein